MKTELGLSERIKTAGRRSGNAEAIPDARHKVKGTMFFSFKSMLGRYVCLMTHNSVRKTSLQLVLC